MSETIRQIAERIREMRDISALSGKEVAAKLGIPLETYNDYENGVTDIPVSMLYELAKVFEVDFTELLTGLSPRLHNYCLVKKGEGVEVERYKGYKFQSLAYNFVNKKVEPLLVTVEPEENKKMSLVAHPGQEFNYVLEGKIKVILAGHEVEISEGDSIYFDPTIPHGQIAVDGKQAKFLTVILHD
ncbi:MAG: XRE family transcriptional regulator [Bacillota bacterium]|nr:XRE family transcriptional regulator [Bacillota bacterium]